MPKNDTLNRITLFFGMVSTLLLEVWIGTSMMLSGIVTLVYYKVSESSKSVVTFILLVKLRSQYQNSTIYTHPILHSIYTSSRVKYMFQLTLTVLIPCNALG